MGRIIIHLHGKPKEKSLKLLINKYLKRLESESIKVIEHSDHLSSKEYLLKLIKYVKKGFLILIDQTGMEHNSLEFSNLVHSWKLESQDTHLAIGPAAGFPENDTSLIKLNLLKISLSRMTFPHELAALILVEQLYRSIQILNGTKYHK